MGGAGNGPAFFIAAQRKGLERTEEIPQLTTNIGADEKELKRRAEIPHVKAMVDISGCSQPKQRKPVSMLRFASTFA